MSHEDSISYAEIMRLDTLKFKEGTKEKPINIENNYNEP